MKFNIKKTEIKNEIFKKINLNENKIIKFNPEEAEIKDYLKKIKNFGNLYEYKYKFKKCPISNLFIMENDLFQELEKIQTLVKEEAILKEKFLFN